MSRGCFRNFGYNTFGVQRSVYNLQFEVSRCCLVSLRDLELRTRPCCPEVALEIVSVTFSVSRDRFRNFHFDLSRGWTLERSKRISGSASPVSSLSDLPFRASTGGIRKRPRSARDPPKPKNPWFLSPHSHVRRPINITISAF